MPVGMPHAELAEGLVAGDHGATQRPAGGLAEEAREDVEKQPANNGEELPVVTKEHTQDLGDCPDELSMGQAQQQVLAEVLAEQEGSLLGARRAEEVALAGEGAEPVETALRAPDASDALAPVPAEAECRGGSRDEGEAEPAEGGA